VDPVPVDAFTHRRTILADFNTWLREVRQLPTRNAEVSEDTQLTFRVIHLLEFILWRENQHGRQDRSAGAGDSPRRT
jgi:hypothetical protein